MTLTDARRVEFCERLWDTEMRLASIAGGSPENWEGETGSLLRDSYYCSLVLCMDFLPCVGDPSGDARVAEFRRRLRSLIIGG